MSRKSALARAALEDLYYKEGLSQREIAVRLRCSENTVRRRLKEYGLPTPYRDRTDFLRRRGEFSERCRWTPEIAYAVGLIVSDGSLSIDGRHITFTSSDLKLVEVFCCCLQLENRIAQTLESGYGGHACHRVQFSDVVFYRWLLDIGLMPNKSHNLNALNVPDSRFADFLRGYLDGDGSFHVYTDRYKTIKKKEYIYGRLFTRFFSVSRDYLTWLQCKLTRLLGTKGAILRCTGDEEQGVVCWELRYAKADSIRIVRWMYYDLDAPCLGRKRNLISHYLEVG
jgi:hypothetical protein